MKQRKIRRFETLSRSRWTRTTFLGLFVAYGLLLGSCGPTTHLPSTSTTVNVKDSTVFHIKDSVRIVEKTRYKDFGELGDTLRLAGTRSRAWAVCDSLRGVLVGALEEDEIKEHYKTVYKDKLVEVHDTTKVEIPVEVETIKEVEVIPRFWRVMGTIGIILTLAVLGITGFKIYRLKGTGFLKLFKNKLL